MGHVFALSPCQAAPMSDHRTTRSGHRQAGAEGQVRVMARSWWLAVRGAIVALLGAAVSLVPSGTASAATSVFGFTGGLQSFTVPAGVTSVTITALGAAGDSSGGFGVPIRAGGRGASVLALPVHELR
jgi:hypothetical protein